MDRNKNAKIMMVVGAIVLIISGIIYLFLSTMATYYDGEPFDVNSVGDPGYEQLQAEYEREMSDIIQKELFPYYLIVGIFVLGGLALLIDGFVVYNKTKKS